MPKTVKPKREKFVDLFLSGKIGTERPGVEAALRKANSKPKRPTRSELLKVVKALAKEPCKCPSMKGLTWETWNARLGRWISTPMRREQRCLSCQSRRLLRGSHAR